MGRHKSLSIMRIIISILLLTISLQFWTKADDISDFEIEGMGLGNSLLSYISLKEIKIAEENSTYYKDNKYVTIFVNKQLNQYEDLQVVYKPNDKKYIIHEIKGTVDFVDNINQCNTTREQILRSVTNLFPNAEKISEVKPHEYDKSNQSIVHSTWLLPKKGGYIHIACTDWGKKMYEKHLWVDNLEVVIGSEEFRRFLTYEAYK